MSRSSRRRAASSPAGTPATSLQALCGLQEEYPLRLGVQEAQYSSSSRSQLSNVTPLADRGADQVGSGRCSHLQRPPGAASSGHPGGASPRSARRVAALWGHSRRWRFVGHGRPASRFWPVAIRICASLTHGRVIGSPSGGGVAYAGWHVGLRHCFAASAQPLTAASTLHALLLPPR